MTPQRSFLQIFHVSKLLEFMWIYLNFPEFIWIFWNLFEFSWIYLDLSEFIDSPQYWKLINYQNLINYWNLPQNGNCQDLLNFWKIPVFFHFWIFPSFIFHFWMFPSPFSEFSEIYLLFTKLTNPIWIFWIFFRIFLEPPWIF